MAVSAVPHLSDVVDAVGGVVDTTVAPAAAEVDRTGAYPRTDVEALAAAGALGLLSAPEVGGAGGTLADVAAVLERIARADASTAMVVLMHYAAVSVIEPHGPEDVRREIAAGRHLSTLAFSERGSRSHFWAPTSTATAVDDGVRLDATKSWVTSAGEADSYVWSSRPVSAEGPMTLWLVPGATPRVTVAGAFDGFGLRGNGSSPMTADGAVVPTSARLGDDGAGLDVALGTALPYVPRRQRRGVARADGGAGGRGRGPPHLHPPRAPRPEPGRAAADPRSPSPRLRTRVDTDPRVPRRHPRRRWARGVRTRRCACCRSRRWPPRRRRTSPTG